MLTAGTNCFFFQIKKYLEIYYKLKWNYITIHHFHINYIPNSNYKPPHNQPGTSSLSIHIISKMIRKSHSNFCTLLLCCVQRSQLNSKQIPTLSSKSGWTYSPRNVQPRWTKATLERRSSRGTKFCSGHTQPSIPRQVQAKRRWAQSGLNGNHRKTTSCLLAWGNLFGRLLPTAIATLYTHSDGKG